ncbi:MAG: tRNA uridine-5-carboxymethylaminomethyl(34) synthesis enzyme MnmG, partial [Lacticaseibacillus paracasei]
LRHDNADLRLTPMGHELGLISDERYAEFLAKRQAIETELNRLNTTRLKPKDVNPWLEAHHYAPLKDGVLASDFLKRPEIDYQTMAQFLPDNPSLDHRVIEQVEIQIKYAGYIAKEEASVAKLKRLEGKKIPLRINYAAINGLATEARQKLVKIQPETIAQASRISGVNPADVAILSVYIEQGRISKVAQ